MSDPSFRTLHALRIKGFAKTDTVAELAGIEVATAEQQLIDLQASGHVQFRETRSLWQLTPDGRVAHADALAADVAPLDREALQHRSEPFLELDRAFKELCGHWQLRDGETNDHGDTAYDAAVFRRLVELDERAQELLAGVGEVWPRLAAYGPRLAETCRRVAQGETSMLTGVMCGSYHDVWMELHEDLILTQGIDRAEEGSI